MARPRSEDKRNAILAAATEVFAGHGLSAPTVRIAREAKVAEGTLFTYFRTKDELLNQLYLALKLEMRETMMAAYPHRAGIRERLHHLWCQYVGWGMAQPDKRKVMLQLAMSAAIDERSRAISTEAFAEVGALLQESMRSGLLRDGLPAEFVPAILGALAEMTMDLILRAPDQAEGHTRIGFEACWNAIAKP
ncbi:TetR/AcrR family transcriptional regulator [Luteimonas aquatica]|uniref:TetR/AcrR family transcriptional regulator n=1 Tax=Luteimonas aquatica TaxID=450364 RepID=UPI001F5A004A|nr:TetR/AcrR family transcriptional regulator [Luteimonas aquatica]